MKCSKMRCATARAPRATWKFLDAGNQIEVALRYFPRAVTRLPPSTTQSICSFCSDLLLGHRHVHRHRHGVIGRRHSRDIRINPHLPFTLEFSWSCFKRPSHLGHIELRELRRIEFSNYGRSCKLRDRVDPRCPK